jgi:hypothetical protein
MSLACRLKPCAAQPYVKMYGSLSRRILHLLRITDALSVQIDLRLLAYLLKMWLKMSAW